MEKKDRACIEQTQPLKEESNKANHFLL